MFKEMPTAVFCSLMAGICAVIEIHYSFDYSYLYWSEKWTFAAADAVALVFVHAGTNQRSCLIFYKPKVEICSITYE